MFNRLKQNIKEKTGRAGARTQIPSDVEKNIRHVNDWKKRIDDVLSAYNDVLKKCSAREEVAAQINGILSQLGPSNVPTGTAAYEIERKILDGENKSLNDVKQELHVVMENFKKGELKSLQDVCTRIGKRRLDKDAAASDFASKETPQNKSKAEIAEKAFDDTIEEARTLYKNIEGYEDRHNAAMAAALKKHAALFAT